MSNLQQRVVSAVILAIAVLGLTWLGGFWFRLLCVILAAAMYFEWSAMSAKADTKLTFQIGAIGLAVGLGAMLLGSHAWVAFGLVILAAIVAYGLATSQNQTPWAAGGVLYAGLAALAMAYLRGADYPGFLAIIYLFAVVWATDILAYFVGRSVGGPKLAPSISPGKTRSGAFGGAVGAVLAALLFGLVAKTGNLSWLALVALPLSFVSQAGDLFESWVKRRHGVKDSGWIIPGHGGVMDRVDGLVVAAFVLYLIGAARGGMDTPAWGLFGI